MIHKNNGSEFNYFVHKISHVQNIRYANDEVYTYTPQFFSMTLHFFILPSFLFTRNLRIDKNYTLSIFMLSGSIMFYSNFQFNMACIYHKTMPLYQTILMLIHFHMLSLYKSMIISKYAFPHATNHLTQIMRFKHVFLKTCLVYKSHFHLSKFVISLCLYNSHS